MTTIVRSVRLGKSPVRVVPVVGGPPGAAGMVWRGDWSAATAYVKLDGVAHSGASYICTAAVGPTATAPDADTGHWDLLAKAGTDGTGTMNGPVSAVDGNLAVWDGTDGTKVKDGGAPAAPATAAPADLGTAAVGSSAKYARENHVHKKPTLGDLGAASSAQGAAEKVAALSATTGTCTGNLTNASIFTISPTGNWTLAFSNVPATGTSCLATVIVTESATVRTMTQPAGVKAMGAALPASTASKVRIYNYETVNGGTTWYVSAAVEQ